MAKPHLDAMGNIKLPPEEGIRIRTKGKGWRKLSTEMLISDDTRNFSGNEKHTTCLTSIVATFFSPSWGYANTFASISFCCAIHFGDGKFSNFVGF